MAKIIAEGEIEFKSVEWGLTKEIVAPHNAGSEKIKVKLTEFLPGYIHERHTHPDQEEVIYVLSGKGMARTVEEEKEIGPGTVIFIPADEPHAIWNESRTESLKTIIIKSPPDDEEVRV
jgi:quercetin dioxygenase-like cupin family protein